MTTLYDKADNTKKAYLMDLCVFFRELFTRFWEFDLKYNFIAEEIVLKYVENQGIKQLDRKELKQLRDSRIITKNLPVLSSSSSLFENRPLLKISDGKLRMDLNPMPSSIDNLIEISQEDYELVNIPFGRYAKELEPDFFSDIFRLEKLSEVMEHLKDNLNNSNNTLARKHSSLKSFEFFLEEIGLVDRVMMHRVPRPREMQNAQPYLTEEEMCRFLESIRYYPENSRKELWRRDKAMFGILYGTGIRKSELVNIETGDVDLKESTIFLQRTKGGESREVCLPGGIIEDLRTYEDHRDGMYKESRDKKRYYFLSCRNQRMDPRSVFSLVDKYLIKAGINKRISPHSFRRSAATHMADRGASVWHIKQFLGHKNLMTTGKYLSSSRQNLDKLLREHHPLGEKNL